MKLILHEKNQNFCKKLITIDDNYNRKFASDINNCQL